MVRIKKEKRKNKIMPHIEGHTQDPPQKGVADNSTILQRIGVDSRGNFGVLGTTMQELGQIEGGLISKANDPNNPFMHTQDFLSNDANKSAAMKRAADALWNTLTTTKTKSMSGGTGTGFQATAADAFVEAMQEARRVGGANFRINTPESFEKTFRQLYKNAGLSKKNRETLKKLVSSPKIRKILSVGTAAGVWNPETWEVGVTKEEIQRRKKNVGKMLGADITSTPAGRVQAHIELLKQFKPNETGYEQLVNKVLELKQKADDMGEIIPDNSEQFINTLSGFAVDRELNMD